MKKLFKKRNVIIFILVLIVGVAGYIGNDFAMRVSVEMYQVEIGAVEETFVEDGFIDAVKTSEIQAAISGTVEEVLKEVGDVVTKDDVLLLFDDEVILYQIEGLDAEIKALDFQLLEASKPADQERITNASIAVSQAKGNKNKAKDDYENNLVLFNSGNLSQSALDQSKKLYDDALKAYNIAINESKLVNKGVSENIESQYQASIEALYAQKKILESQLEDYAVDAPMAGTVLSSHVKSGHYVMIGQPLYEIADLSQLKLVCEILEDDYHLIDRDSHVRLYDKILDKYYDASISKIYPKSESSISDLGIKQNRVKIEVLPNESLEDYIVGQTLDIEFVIHEKPSVKRVPIDAVFKSKGEYYVFVVMNGMIEQKLVEVGIEGDDYYEILSGLESGDDIVKVITNDLEEGLKIK